MRRWIWLLVLVIWLGALAWPYSGLPPLREFLLYPTSPLQISYEAKDQQIKDSPQSGLDIRYNQRGVPHIFAPGEPSMAFGMGYVHARDRMFQMEMLRRTVRGRLSEVVGKRALPSDRWWLKFGFEKQSKAAFQRMQKEAPEVTAMFEAYARGFNYYLENMPAPAKALEFHLLGFEPTPLEPHDPVMLVRYMDKVLNYGENDLRFSALRNHLPDSLIEFYYPWISEYAFPIYPEIDSSYTPAEFNNTLTAYQPQGNFPNAQVRRHGKNEVGSNNWSVAGERTASGNAFLCNDTHLGLDLPGTWYEVHQVVNGRAIHGFSIPGAPFIISGFTEDVAWGMTNATWDLTEFYALETDEQERYKLDGQWVQMKKRRDTIPVKGAVNEVFEYYQTYFGPADTLDGEFLATQWVAQKFDSNEMQAFYELTHARYLKEAYEAMQYFGHPPQNFVLADKHGDIGMVTSGYAMERDTPSRGISIGTRRADKIEFVHQGRKLYVLNPEKGWNQSSNHHQITDRRAVYLNSIFAPSARGRRISEMLAQDSSVDRSYLESMHGDVQDGEWPLLRDHLLATAPEDVLRLLKDWNGECTVESKAATVYNMYKWNLRDSLSSVLLGEFDFQPPAEQIFYLVSKYDKLPLPGDSLSVRELASGVWNKTLGELYNRLGKDPAEWEYGNYHKVYFRHLTRMEALSHPPFPAKGSPRTVNVATGLPTTHGPSMRTLIELRPDGPVAQTVIAAGQSGQPGHRHYTDQIDDWRDLQYFEVEWLTDPGQKDVWEESVKFK